MAIARIASLSGNTEWKLSAADSYANLAPAVLNPFSGYAQILSNTPSLGPVIPGSDFGQAQYLWYLPSVDPGKIATGETAYFYRRVVINFESLSVSTRIGVHISVCADNAFLGRVSLAPVSFLDPAFFDIVDGPLELNTSATEIAPFNWQKVYESDVEVDIPILSAVVTVEFELKVVNYEVAPNGNNYNPAGFIYNIEIDGLPDSSIMSPGNNSNPSHPLS